MKIPSIVDGIFYREYASTEIRTPVLALKGLRPGPLDDGGAGNILPNL